MRPVAAIRYRADRYLRRRSWRVAAHDQWIRQASLDSINARIVELDPSVRSAVEISGRNFAGRSWKEYEALEYPEFDLCNSTPTRTYDVVICEHVLEHVADPIAAARTLRAMSAGICIVATPFLYRVHGAPDDYWRFTPDGLELLLRHAGFADVEVHSWGNRRAVIGSLRYDHRRRWWRPMRDDPRLPVVVWAYATV